MKKTAPLIFYYEGYEKCAKNHFYGPTTRIHYLVHFIISGKGEYHIDNHVFHLSKNQCFIIPPKKITYYKADSTDPWEYMWLAFAGEEAERILLTYNLDENKYIGIPQDSEKLQNFLQQAIPCFQDQKHNQTELTGWFYLFFSCFKDKNPQHNDKTYLHYALKFIQDNYTTDVNIDDIAQKIGIDRTYLYKLCKKYTRISPKEFLTMNRLAAAKDMLRYSKQKITDIALSSGFHDSSAFCKIFQKYEKISPSEYRKQFSIQ